jgi:hypothetical protein
MGDRCRLAAGHERLYLSRRERAQLVAAAIMLMAALTGCAGVPNRPPRLESSSYGCMRAVVRDKLPANLPDKRAHCLASGLIARYCSVSEARLAGAGKEFRDLLGAGDAESSDLRANRAGIECARQVEDDQGVARCCSERGY